MNASLREAAIVEVVLPHILRTHKVPFTEILVVVDTRPREGKLAAELPEELPADEWQRFSSLTSSLVADGCRVRLLEVDYAPAVMRDVNNRWFGTEVAVRCSNGSPIYAYIYGLDSCACDARIHVDCDMLFFDPGPVSWIAHALSIIDEHENVVFANPVMGPVGPSEEQHDFLAAVDEHTGLRVSQRFSTRCFLFELSKLERTLLPLRPFRHDVLRRLRYRLERRSPFPGLEEIIAANLAAKGLVRCDLDPSYGFCIHAWDKRVLLDAKIARIIRDVESGQVPEVQRNRANLEPSW
jgi:hypothetical protein